MLNRDTYAYHARLSSALHNAHNTTRHTHTGVTFFIAAGFDFLAFGLVALIFAYAAPSVFSPPPEGGTVGAAPPSGETASTMEAVEVRERDGGWTTDVECGGACFKCVSVGVVCVAVRLS